MGVHKSSLCILSYADTHIGAKQWPYLTKIWCSNIWYTTWQILYISMWICINYRHGGFNREQGNILNFKRSAYFPNLSKRNFIRKVDGLPTTTGSFWVEQDTADTIHPAPTSGNFKMDETCNVILQKERGSSKI